MAVADVVLSMKLDNKLSPELKKAYDDMVKLSKSSITLKSKLDDFKAIKKGILTGAITSDIGSIKKLQDEVKRLNSAYNSARTPTARRNIKTSIKQADARLLAEYNREVLRLGDAYRKTSLKASGLAKNTTRQYLAQLKSTTSIRRNTKALQEQSRNMETTTNGIVRMIRRYESLLVGMYALKRGYDLTVGRGLEFNKLIERETVGLKLLIAQNLQNVDVLGKSVTAQEKFNYAQKEAVKAIDNVRKINVETPHTLGETLQIYKLLVPQVLKLGGSLEEVGQITKNVSIAGASMGIEFQQLLKTVDSLMSGQMKESGLKRAMEQFGISQKEVNSYIKEGGDVVQLFIDKLKQVDPAGKEIQTTWQGVASQFINQYDKIQGELSKELFASMKADLNSITKYLKENEKAIISNVHTIGSLSKALLEIGVAYSALKIGMRAYNGLLASSARNTALATRYNNVFAKSMSAAQLQALKLSRGLKALFLSNPLFITATAIMTAYELATRGAAEASEKLADATSKTKDEIFNLGEAQRAVAINAINLRLKEIELEKKKLEYARGARGTTSNTIKRVLTVDDKARQESLKQETEELKKQKNIIVQTAPPIHALREARKAENELLIANNKEISRLSSQIENNNQLTEETVSKYKEKIRILKKENSNHAEAISHIDKERTALGDTVILANGVAKAVGGITSEMKKSASAAYSLRDALLQADRLQGKISQKEFINKKYLAKVASIEGSTEIGSDERKAQLVKASLDTQKELNALRKTETEATLRLNKARQEQSIIIARGNGNRKEEIRLTKKQYEQEQESLRGKIKVSSGTEKIILQTKLQESKNKLLGLEYSLTKKINSSSSKGIKANIKLAENQLALRKEYYRLIGDKEKSFGIDATEKLTEMMKSGVFSQAEMSKAYDAMWKDFRENGREAISELGDSFADIFQQGFESILKGDFAGGLADIMGDAMSQATSNISGAFSKGLGNIFSGAGSFMDAFKSINPMDWIGSAVSLVGGLFSTALSEAQIKAAAGRSGDDINSKGTAQIISTLESANAKQYGVSNSMLTHLKSMDENLIGALNNVQGLDLAGSTYTPKTSSVLGGVLFASNTELIGAGIKFSDQAVSSFVEGVEANGYEAVKKTSSFLGIFTSESISESLKELPDKTKTQIGEAFNQGLQSALDGLDILGFDAKAIEKELQDYVVSIGKIDFKDLSIEEQAQALNRALTEQLNGAISGAMDNIADPYFYEALQDMATAGEEITSTIARVAVGFETVGSSLRALGTEVETFTQSNALIEATGSLNAWKSAQDQFISMLSKGEQEEYTKNMLQQALAVYDVALPASKAQFIALKKETEAKIIATQAQIDAMKASIRADVAANNYKIEADGNYARSAISTAENINKAAILTGKSANDMIKVAKGASVETSTIDYTEAYKTDVGLQALESELDKLQGLYGTLMSNMSSFSSYYDGVTQHATETTNAIEEATKTILEQANYIASLTGNSYDVAMQELKNTREEYNQYFFESAEEARKKLLGEYEAGKAINEDSFNALKTHYEALKKLEDAMYSNRTSVYSLMQKHELMTATDYAEKMKDIAKDKYGVEFSSYSEAVDAFKDAMDAGIDSVDVNKWTTVLDAFKETVVGVSDYMKEVSDIYTGSLSYLNSYEKSIFSDKMANYYKETGDTESYMSELKKKLEFDNKMARTAEERESNIDKYLKELRENNPKEVQEEMLEELKKVKLEIQQLRKTTKTVARIAG